MNRLKATIEKQNLDSLIAISENNNKKLKI